ncbi:hypothetical protein MXD63_11405 [Frankia sp. Cpl3]|nr:hypothetical protein [Frankia sp. Cpl3]
MSPRQLPAGVATSAIGGLYLAWLLTRECRSGRARAGLSGPDRRGP